MENNTDLFNSIDPECNYYNHGRHKLSNYYTMDQFDSIVGSCCVNLTVLHQSISSLVCMQILIHLNH